MDNFAQPFESDTDFFEEMMRDDDGPIASAHPLPTPSVQKSLSVVTPIPPAPRPRVEATQERIDGAQEKAPLASEASWETTKAGYPLTFARSALFGAVQRKKQGREDWFFREPIAMPASSGIKMAYTGPRLNQYHALVFQALIEATAGAKHDLVISHGDVLDMVGRKNNSQARKWLWDVFNDLFEARLRIETPRVTYRGGLVPSIATIKKTGRLKITLDHNLAGLFQHDLILTGTKQTAALGNDQLLLWMSRYVSSHQTFHPIAVTELHRISGFEGQLKEFRFRLKKVAALLACGASPLIQSWSIDDRDFFLCTKRATKVFILPTQQRVTAEPVLVHSSAADKARAQRAKVAL